jgi:hypothetical protein
MRRLAALLFAACASREPPPSAPPDLVARADEAAVRSDWITARRAFEEIAIDYPEDPTVTLRLARIQLEAFGDIRGAEALLERMDRRFRARSLHGLGRCALWRGDEERALDLFRESLKAKPAAECARDLAIRLLARGDPAGDALDVVEALSGATLRSSLLLAAAGRRPAPDPLPGGWAYALERARLRPLPEARREVALYLDRACATVAAREAMARVLEGDLALRRPSAVTVR